MDGVAELGDIARAFLIEAEFHSAERFGSGHINDTYRVITRAAGGEDHFVLQRINKGVFGDPVALMENIRRVTNHLKTRCAPGHTSLDLVPTRDGGDFHVDASGEYWRMYRQVPGTRSYDIPPSKAHARQAAAEFGRFQAMLHDLPGPPLNEVIPGFHDTRARYAAFHDAVSRDTHQRAMNCHREIEWALAQEQAAGTLATLHARGDLPTRVTHNDTKINNVLFDIDSQQAVCIVDLDTVMPGLVLYDFGDLVRTASTGTAEDETNLSAVRMRMDYFDALVGGYLDTACGFLSAAEVELLPLAAQIITIETGLRFLTDYLEGDSYFRIQRPAHNLDRCRAQFALAGSIDEQMAAMRETTSAAYRRSQ
ncbi:MAG: aminoglycoside phosphotransferase family protein [Woeseiaceae bacterium]|nr:aminoglycoside phosphotransferase family protein [Woeseiaceae bacterium]